MTEKPCLFDNEKECPVRNAGVTHLGSILTNACPLCPKRAEMLQKVGAGKGTVII